MTQSIFGLVGPAVVPQTGQINGPDWLPSIFSDKGGQWLRKPVGYPAPPAGGGTRAFPAASCAFRGRGPTQ